MNLRQLFSRMIMYKRYLKPFGVRKKCNYNFGNSRHYK